jgi:hypothetical protein
MRKIIHPNPEAPFNLIVTTFNYYASERPLAVGGKLIKLPEKEFALSFEGTSSPLVETDEDLLLNGETIFAETKDGYFDRILAHHQTIGFFPLWYHIVDASAIPGDLDFFEAWEATELDATVRVNMTKARAIHLVEIRKVRDAELVKKDVPFMRAVEAGDTDAQATIGTEKQVLRDLPATFDLTTGVDTPEKLKAKWPTELPDRE